MDMTPEEKLQAEKAKRYVQGSKSLLIEKFADFATHSSEVNPVSIFMAGSPGAGKTEFSKRLVEALFEQKQNPVRIDADEIRDWIPGYTGANSHVFQGASSRGVDILYSSTLARRQSVILDGTFAWKEKVFNNIERSLSRGRPIQVYYLFQKPEVAWEFTKQREALENRRVTKDVFVKAFLAAHTNVIAAKAHFGENIKLNVVLKDMRDPTRYEVHLDTADVDQFIPWEYSYDTLMQTLI